MSLDTHAYVVRGTYEAVDSVLKLLKKEGIDTEGNPDILARTYPSFTIDDARTLRERAALRSVGENGRIFIIAAPTIPPDAQNALLKTFEEPTPGTKFFLIVSSPETLLPTLRSRMQPLSVHSKESISAIDTKLFLKSTPEKRIEMLKPILEKGEDDPPRLAGASRREAGKRDLAGTISFLADLEHVLANKPRENAAGLTAVYRGRRYITDRGALVKSLLEQVALLVPKTLS